MKQRTVRLRRKANWFIIKKGRKREFYSSFMNRICSLEIGYTWYECFDYVQFQAALLLSQMRKIEKQNNIRRENGKILFRELSELEGIDPPEYHLDTERDIYYLVCFRYDREKWDGIPRKNVLKAIQAEGIPVSGGYEYPLFKNRNEIKELSEKT